MMHQTMARDKGGLMNNVLHQRTCTFSQQQPSNNRRPRTWVCIRTTWSSTCMRPRPARCPQERPRPPTLPSGHRYPTMAPPRCLLRHSRHWPDRMPVRAHRTSASDTTTVLSMRGAHHHSDHHHPHHPSVPRRPGPHAMYPEDKLNGYAGYADYSSLLLSATI